jgi:hypothetical protein
MRGRTGIGQWKGSVDNQAVFDFAMHPHMPSLPTALQIIALHDRLLNRADWPACAPVATSATAPGADPAASEDSEVWTWIQTNHLFNSRLWAEEDLARRTRVSDSEIAANKRAIDGFNQARNDATERVDECLLIALGLVDAASARSDSPLSTAAAGARLNSETAGSMVDRMSIMALKIGAMRAQTLRSEVDDAHRAASHGKLDRLELQRLDLGRCFDDLIADSLAGRACFKVYRQFKMYNDARFNPALVAEQHAAAASA